MKQEFGDVDNFLDWTKLKSKKVNKTRQMVGSLIYHTDIDNSYLIETAVFKKQGGEYRLMPYKLPKKGFCDFIASDELFVKDLVEYTNFTYPVPCPLVKVSYYNKLGRFFHIFLTNRELTWFQDTAFHGNPLLLYCKTDNTQHKLLSKRIRKKNLFSEFTLVCL